MGMDILVVTMILKGVSASWCAAVHGGGDRGECLARVPDLLQFLGQFHTTKNFYVICWILKFRYTLGEKFCTISICA